MRIVSKKKDAEKNSPPEKLAGNVYEQTTDRKEETNIEVIFLNKQPLVNYFENNLKTRLLIW